MGHVSRGGVLGLFNYYSRFLSKFFERTKFKQKQKIRQNLVIVSPAPKMKPKHGIIKFNILKIFIVIGIL
jgi:hypothetical protein